MLTRVVRPFAIAFVICTAASTGAVARPPGAPGAPPGAAAAPRQGAAPTRDPRASQGEALFLQRCALCHLSPDGWRKSGLAPPIGPSLTGVMKDGAPEREAAVRETIRVGSASMPGFQYGLDARQLDHLIAYLRTLNQE